ncbi:unnamed protein product, partial [Brenthis ino]
MDAKRTQTNQHNRFQKLSLKKNVGIDKKDTQKCKGSFDILVIDDSFDRLMSQYSNNVSFSSRDLLSPTNQQSRPSIDGWSPHQNVICATPRHNAVPTTPKDKTNESLEQCSLKKIQNSHQKLLSDLYGDTWKSIPSLFKSIKQKHEDLDVVAKKLHFNDDENDKENIRSDLKRNKELYLTSSETKIRRNGSFEEKKSKKKLYTEKIPSTPDLPKQRPRNVKSSTKKGMSVTELVRTMTDNVNVLTNHIQNVTVTPKTDVNRLSFVASLAENIPSWRCHPEAIQYHDNYKELKEKLARRLYKEFNKVIFDDAMDADLPIIWDTKLRSTAGTTTNRLIKTSNGSRIRASTIKLSTKVLDAVQRLRDTLIHELCHAATWLIDGEMRAGHGPLWKKWAKKSLKLFPELGEISRCHDMEIHYKYTYKCMKCGYSIKRHSKSIDTTKKCCGYCRGMFEIIVNKKNKDGVIISTKAKKGGLNDFAKFVKENYGSLKQGRTHAEVMKLLGEQFSVKKNKKYSFIDLSCE